VLPIEPAVASYEDIDDVPSRVIQDLVLHALASYGATAEEDVLAWVRDRLGFKRTGNRIRTRIEGCIAQLLGDVRVSRAGANCLRLPQPLQASQG
jgi:hypothetical protein